MQTPWQFVVLLLAACFTLPLAVVIWRNWHLPMARPFAAALVMCGGWCLIAALEISTASLDEKIFLFRTRMSFLPFIPPLLLEAYYRYATGKKLLIGWRIPLLIAIPVISAVLVWVPGDLFCYAFRLAHTGEFYTLVFSRGPMNIVYYAYCTTLALVAVWMMAATWAQSPPWMQRGSLLFIVIYMVPASVDLLFVLGHSPTVGLNYTPMAFAASALLLAWVMFGERILSLGPVARSLLMEHLKEPLFVIDDSYRVIDANGAAARLCGVVREKLIGRRASKVFGQESAILPLLQGGPVEQREIHLPETPGDWECSVYLVPEDNPHARLVLLRDVTHNKEIEKALLRAKEAAESSDQAKSSFLAMMSHEIRTPMSGVIGYAQLLEGTPLTPEQLEYVQMIQASGQAQLRIINDILDYSKVEAGRIEFEHRPFRLRPEVENSCHLLLPQARAKGIDLRWQVAADVPDRLEGDSLRIGQVMLNLLGNAIKFTETGSVDLTVAGAPTKAGVFRLQLIVTDTGIGIPRDAMDHLFDSFSQVETSTARRYGGTGLGLAISQRLCRQMGGDITVHSEEGRGSVFTATMDLQLVPETGARISAPHADTGQEHRPLEILVVEDNTTNQRLAKAMLRKLGHEAVLCGDGAAAIELLKERRFDAIFMDIEMPGMDGFETVGEIRRAERDGVIPVRNYVIALTAHAVSGDRERCLAAGMDDYVTKPLMFDTLRAALQKRPV